MWKYCVVLGLVGTIWSGCGGDEPGGPGGADAGTEDASGVDAQGFDAEAPDTGGPEECSDSDVDGVCDEDDICPIGADSIDSDGDGVPDACDVCAAGDDRQDADADTVPDACDVCADGDDLLDMDRDGVPNACDTCERGADAIDGDADGVPDACDICLAGDDALDADSDGVPDACDECAEGDDRLDLDFDRVPDACDVCPTGDNALDGDADGVPDGCDVCQGFDDGVDVDVDGVPDGCDGCLEDPNGPDADGDGVPDGCDICPGLDDAAQGVRDGTFADPTQWTPSSAVNDPFVTLFYDSSTTTLRQTLCTPAVEVTPRMLSLDMVQVCSGSRCFAADEVTLDGVTHKVPAFYSESGAYLNEFCLGEAYYGGTGFSVSGAGLSSSTDYLGVSRILDEEAPDVCPRIGEFGNGDFSRDLDMWFNKKSVSIVDNAGDKAMRLRGASPNACSSAYVDGRVSVPLGLSNGAVRFRWRGGVLGNSLWQVQLISEENTKRVIQDNESVTWRDETICLPESVQGASLILRMNMTARSSVSCSASVTRDVEVDDFEIVSDPVACP